MSEINHLTLPAIAFNTMANHRAEPLVQRFGQLLAQINPEEQEQAWAKAAEILADVNYTDEAGQPQAYVIEGVLTDAAKQRIQIAREQLKQETGAAEVSIEQGAQLLLVQALTTQYAEQNDPAILERARTLQTELYAELNPPPAVQPIAAETNQIKLADLESRLATQLQQLGISSRQEFENSMVDLDHGQFVVSNALLGETDERVKLQLLIGIAAQQIQQLATQNNAPFIEEQAPPAVSPAAISPGDIEEDQLGNRKLPPGDLYEIDRGRFTSQDMFNFIMFSFLQYEDDEYYGSTYHLQFLDADGEVMRVAPVISNTASSGADGVQQAREVFGQSSDHMSVYWHGFNAESGTQYSVLSRRLWHNL